MLRHWTVVGLIVVVLGLFGATGRALAQQPVPPEHYTLDPHGVDLISGRFIYQAPEVSIGPAGGGGLTYGRLFITPSTGGGTWRMNVLGTINVSGSTVTVSVGSDSEIFTLSGGVYTPVSNSGATLTKPSGYVFTTSSGTMIRLQPFAVVTLTPYVANAALIESITTPAGEVTTYHYLDDLYCPNPSPDPGECMGALAPISRIQSITNNRGYMLHFQYAASDPLLDKDGWLKLDKVTGINLAVDYCAPLDLICGGLTRNWPSVTYADVVAGATATDQSGRVTTYLSPGFKVRYPGTASPNFDIDVALTSAKVSSVTDASGAWTYTYATSGTTQTTEANGPLGEKTTVIANLTTGRATSVGVLTATSPTTVTQTTSYLYDAQRRLTRITQTEGNRVDYTLDARGNVTQTVATDKAGSATITTSAAYAASCANPVTCNRPTSTTDARGYRTDYVWNGTHGGLESVTAPAPSGAIPVGSGTRPQTRISYAAQTAYALNGLGGYAALSPSIMLPVSTSACATNAAPACVGTSDETRTTVTYGSSGVANNLLPTVTTSGDGTGTLAVTTTMAWDHNGDPFSVDGPLSGVGDYTRYRYDAARQLVGVVGPDPDGAGTLLNRAQRLTYNARGQVTLTEAGTTSGYSDANWSSFATLQRQATTYDAIGRPIIAMQQDAAGNALSLQQVSYDAAGRLDCTATRMNMGVIGALPPSACTPTTLGAFGPDRIVQTAYDLADRPISATSGVGTASTITESVSYTLNGMTASLTDGNGNVSTYAYDGFDRVFRQCYPGAATCASATPTVYEEYTYDAGSNVTAFRNRAADVISAGYDNLNRRVSLGSAISDRAYSYDNLNRPITTAFTGGGLSTTNAWDALSRLTSQTQPLGAVTYAYDAAGRRTSMTWPGSPTLIANYDWDFGNDLTAVRENGATSGAGVLATYAYDNLGRRTAVARGNGVGSTWTYDGVSRLSSLIHDLSGTAQDLTLGFTYNPAGQIVSRSVSNTAYVYVPATTAIAYINNILNQLTSLGGSAVTSSSLGDITAVPGATYDYNAESQLTSSVTSLGSAGFSYDPTGRLYQSTGSATRRYLYDGQQVIGEYNDSNAIQTRYLPGMGLDDVVVSYDASNTRTWLLADERQSVVGLTAESGASTATNTYDEYGVPGGSNAGRFQYTGQMWLPDAQLYHYRARAYAPQIGRFMQTDPMGYAAGANLYAYVGGDPVTFSDPLGLDRGLAPPGRTWPDECWKIGSLGTKDKEQVCYAYGSALDITWGRGPGGGVTRVGMPKSSGSKPDRCYQSPNNASLLDYDTVLGYGETARQHITRLHMSGGKRSQYYPGTSFSSVQDLNVFTFVYGWQRWDNGMWVFEAPWFEIPHGAPVDLAFGTDTLGEEANRHRLVLMPDCIHVITSYPF